MKRIELIELKLQNFQGASYALRADGQDTDIFAENGAGKTRLFSAFTYLLFGKDSLGRAEFSLKNLDQNGEVAERGIDHTVEGVICVDGETITLKKIFREKFVKQRGRVEAEFSGHTTQHYVDSVPKTEKEYKEIIAQIAGTEDTFRLLTSPTMFPSLKWERQREILLECCGNISDADVIASDPTLSELPSIVGKKSLDDFKKVIAARRGEINKELPQIAVRIDECRKGMPDITGLDHKAIIHDVAVTEAKLNEAKGRLNGIDNGSNITELSKKLAGINADIQKIENEYSADANRTISKLNQQINEITDAKNFTERNRQMFSDNITDCQKEIDRFESKLVVLRTKWTGIDAEVFQDTTEDTCPACHRSLPSERVEEARTTARAAFNLSKAERLGEVTAEGKKFAGLVDHFKKEIEAMHQKLFALPKEEISADDLVRGRDELKKLASDYSGIKEHRELLNQKAAVEAQIRDARESVSFDKDLISKEIDELAEQLKVAKLLADVFPRREAGEKRVQELKATEKALSAEYERLEKELYLLELFIKTKVGMLTDRINSHFKLVRFILFETQVNGGISETCQISVNGIPFNSGLNNAGRINAGLDVISALQKHFQMAAPIFVDNAEAVNKLLGMECQMICLYVSDDKQLRVEASVKERVAA